MKTRGFLSMDMILIIAGTALFALIVWSVYHKGVMNERAEWVAKIAAEKIERKEEIDGLNGALAAEKAERAKAHDVAEAAMKKLEIDHAQKLAAYVPSGRSCLRAGFVRYTNAAATGVPLDSTPGPGVAEAPGGIGDDEAAAVISRNYARYRTCTARVTDLEKEYDAVRATYNAAVNVINQRAKESMQ